MPAAQIELFRRPAVDAIALGDLHLQLHRDFLDFTAAERLFQVLLEGVSWQQDAISMYGNHYPLPRLHRWFADSPRSYTWSGIQMHPTPFPETLSELRQRVNQLGGAKFDSALCNLYRDGRDSVAWHADDEPEFGAAPVIASLSLGSERHFLLRRKDDHAQRVSIALPHGSLLLMPAGTQQRWEHCLPKTRRPTGARINLTFRTLAA